MAAESAKDILDATGVKGGLVVHIGCGEGKLTAALRASESYLIHGLDTDAKNIRTARENLLKAGLQGSVSVAQLAGNRLPYIDNLVNLVVSDSLGDVPMSEVMRILAPAGVAYIKKTKTVKPRPAEIDEWTHYMHSAGGNAVADDSVVGPPRHLQWTGSPRWGRHHDHMSSVSAVVTAGGRVFYIFDGGSRASIYLSPKWSLIARDAFNGTILWNKPIGQWYTHLMRLKSGPAVLPRRLVAVGDKVYVTMGIKAPLTALDAATGKTILTYKGTESTQEIILSDGILFLVVNKDDDQAKTTPIWGVTKRRVMALQADTGKILWQEESNVLPMTLAADAGGVYFHDGKEAVCLSRDAGKELWRSKPLARWSKLTSYYGATLLVKDGVVLFSGGEKMVPHRGGKDTMTALAAATGKELWTADHPQSGYQSPEDMLVAGGLVWTGSTTNTRFSGVFTGRDLKTGKVKSQFPPNVETYWFHHRCHRGKATKKYLLMSRTGIEYLDIARKTWTINHWVRGACLYGVMPANGLTYAPQHPCACYPEAKLNGFNALAPAAPGRLPPKKVPDKGRLRKGPAYGKVTAPAANDADWSTFRGSSARAGRTKVAVPTDLAQAWQTKIGGKLSTAVAAGGKLFVAAIDTHTIHAINTADGEEAWRYTAGGRVDSPPTIYRGTALFGCADGYVYCLRADDGAVIWRFRAAPDDRRTVSFEQVESLWPVHGSVLVLNDILYCVAGRSMFLDGGLRMLMLDPKTGKKLGETLHDGLDPETGEDLQKHVKVLNMPVALPDILSTDGKYVYMRSQQFDLKGKRIGVPHRPANSQFGDGAHLFGPSGFLDGSYWHRSYWVYGRGFDGGHSGYHVAGKYAPAGKILTFDDKKVYGFGRKAKYYRWTTPIEHHLFADNMNTPRSAGRVGRSRKGKASVGPWVSIANSPSLNPTGKAVTVEAWVRTDKPDGVVIARGGPAQGYALIIKGGRPQFIIRADNKISLVAAKQKVTGRWTHLTGMLTKDKKLKIYVDGKCAASAEAGGLIGSDPVQGTEIGADAKGSVGDYEFPLRLSGSVDEVRVFFGPVTDKEIEAHSTTPGKVQAKDAKLVLCLTFDKDASDLSGKGNSGKIGGGRSVKGKFGQAMQFGSGKAKTLRRKGKKPATGKKPQSGFKHVWARDLPMLVRAMVLSDPSEKGKTLFIAGLPDLVNEDAVKAGMDNPDILDGLEKQDAAWLGRKGAMFWAVSARDGTKLAEYKLPMPPIFDGMIAAGGRLYVVTMDGKITCYAGK
jgi:outer membrane protein assembly factor BamB